MSSTANETKPVLSIILVVYNMKREAPRTLFTLTAEYQNIPSELYEVILVDNGSTPPLGQEAVSAIADNFTYIYLDPGHPSPATALNIGARRARGKILGLMVDGARMLSPGVLQYALRASRSYHNPVISTLGFHLGPAPQPVSVSNGYNQLVEDRLLETVDWRTDGYELFRISAPALSSKYGWLAPMAESNCVFVTAATFHALGGFDTAFDLPGGGFVNLDFYRRACEFPGAELVALLGEGSFHQFHGGAMTGKSLQEASDCIGELNAQYTRLRGCSYSSPLVRCDYLGQVPPSCYPSLREGAERFEQFRREYPDAAGVYDSGAIPPNRIARYSDVQRTVIILGMHRSGTSMLAGSLQEAGLELGDVITEAPHNRKGNREDRAIMHMQEDLLERNGGSWDNPPASIRWNRLHEAVRDLFISRFREERIWGFKDPRTLLTLDGWREVLPSAEFVGIFRSPSLVARSLQRRNNLPIESGLKLWQIYNQRLLDLHKVRPFPLVEFVSDPDELRCKLRQLIEALRLPGGQGELTFFEDELRNKDSEIIPLPTVVGQLYGELQARAI